MDIAASVLIAVLAIGFIWAMRELKITRAQKLEYKDQKLEYKELFETGDSEYKKSQEQIQNLLIAISDKNVTMERASQSLDIAGKKLAEQEIILTALNEKLRLNETQYDKLLGQKKSSEVRTGKITEQIAPFLSDYPRNPRTARFIGDPIDFVHFDEDKVTFVEVKSGKSQLSKKQRGIRDMIKEGKVEFVVYRVEGDTTPEKDGK